MRWPQVDAWVLVSEGGYRIAKVLTGDGVLYSAWAPDVGRAVLEASMCERYAVGVDVPVRCACLGVFASSGKARDVCDVHAFGVDKLSATNTVLA